MGDTEFTSGPWSVGAHFWMGGKPVNSDWGEKNKSVMAGDWSICMVQGDSGKPMENNARLIAAAPDMYAALKLYIEISRCENPIRVPLPNPEKYASNVECKPCGKCRYCIAVSAIAKAEGIV